MKRVGLYLVLLAAGWLAAWLLPGLYLGQADLLLTRSAPPAWKTVYLLSLFGWLLASTLWCWRHAGPAPGSASLTLRPGWFRHALLGVALGLGTVAGSRLVLWLAGRWTPVPPEHPWIAVFAAPAVAMTEELVFRGYLFQVTRESLGRPAAYVGVNLFFALLHLFRPGSLEMKLMLGVSLFLVGILLCLVMEGSGSLWTPVGLHSVWVFQQIADPPGRIGDSWFWGLAGDPLAGVLAWGMMAGTLAPFIGWARDAGPTGVRAGGPALEPEASAPSGARR